MATYQLHIEFWRPLLGTQMLEGLPEATGAEYDEVLADAKRMRFPGTEFYFHETASAELTDKDVARGLKPGGSVLINSPAAPEHVEAFSRFRLAWIDASRIAMTNQIGSRTHPIVNTSMMGAVARVLGMPPLEDVVAAIRDEVPGDAERNVTAAREAFEAVRFAEAVKPAA